MYLIQMFLLESVTFVRLGQSYLVSESDGRGEQIPRNLIVEKTKPNQKTLRINDSQVGNLKS